MTPSQEDALYEFLENVTEPFTLEDVVAFIRMIDPKRVGRLAAEVAALIDSRNIAFSLGTKRWVSRRGCFEPVRFVISPTRLELLNGILIPGHRCVPFANPVLLPQEYLFYWQGRPITAATTEGPPEDFYPYYTIWGEEYAPQYVARDNPENEAAYNSDPYDDPPEVSIRTMDMRNIYRESAFVPGDRFVVRTLDWKAGIFELEKAGKDEWTQAELYAWFEAAEAGFEDSFEFLGPGASTDEQIAYAYWYGGKRMRDVPAYSLEDFLYEKTDRIETVPYGIETRFWYAGKEIPDNKNPEENRGLPDRTVIEEILFQKGIPISEYVVQSYIRDALFRNEPDISQVIERIVPRSVGLDEQGLEYIVEYAAEVLEEFRTEYSFFQDQGMGPIRQRVGELHTAVVDLAARLHKGEIDPSWLPKHTFVILSQIQGHAASVMEDLDMEDPPPEAELEAMDNSLDSMIETYEDIKGMIEEALASFRRNNISVVKWPEKAGSAKKSAGGAGKEAAGTEADLRWQTLQLGLCGTDVWRRIVFPGTANLAELHRVVQILFNWDDALTYRFTLERPPRDMEAGKTKGLSLELSIEDLRGQGVIEVLYEYGSKWAVKVMFLSPHQAGRDEVIRCVAGAGAAPPEFIDGPLRFKRFLSALEKGDTGRQLPALEKGAADFRPDFFEPESCNRRLRAGFSEKKQKPGPLRIDT
jgi:hypothetical protein